MIATRNPRIERREMLRVQNEVEKQRERERERIEVTKNVCVLGDKLEIKILIFKNRLGR
jgi:hypothetical protein